MYTHKYFSKERQIGIKLPLALRKRGAAFSYRPKKGMRISLTRPNIKGMVFESDVMRRYGADLSVKIQIVKPRVHENTVE